MSPTIECRRRIRRVIMRSIRLPLLLATAAKEIGLRFDDPLTTTGSARLSRIHRLRRQLFVDARDLAALHRFAE